MRLLVDNTFIHRVGNVLDSKPGSGIRPIDVLALFHMAEHILFSDNVVVFNFENILTYNRTNDIIEKLKKEGISLASDSTTYISLKTFNIEEYAEACNEAAWHAVEELSVFDESVLDNSGKLVDEASLPDKVKIPPIEKWLDDDYSARANPDELIQSIDSRALGNLEYMVVSNPSLRNRLRNLSDSVGGFKEAHKTVLTVILRIQVNQELAKRCASVYSPAPQRARISAFSNLMFRNRLEQEIENAISNYKNSQPAKLIAELKGLDSLPLPLFAFYALRNSTAQSPLSVLEAARAMRDDKNIIDIRKWLKMWETKISSSKSKERIEALNKINELSEDIAHTLSGNKDSIIASLQPGIDWEFDTVTGQPSWSVHLPSLNEIWSPIRRRFDNNRLFVAAIAKNLAADKELGKNILKQLNRYTNKEIPGN